MTVFSKLVAAASLALALTANPVVAQTPAKPAASTPAAPAAAPAPSPSHLAAARALIDLTNVLETVDQLLPIFGKDIKQQNITRPDLGKDLDVVLAGLDPELKLQREQIYTVVARTYAKFYTEEELRGLVDFFKTPLGTKFLQKQPDLTDEIADQVTSWSQQVSEYVMVRTRAEMAKRGFQMQ